MSLGSNELILYADNTAELYPMKKAIQLNLAKKKRRSNYERESGVRAWKHFANASAKRYVKELKLDESWNRAFTATDRADAAKEWEARFREQYQYGELEYLLPEKMRRAYKPKKNNPHPKKKTTRGKKKSNPRKKRRSPYKRCPIGTEIQSLVFDKDIFSERQAKDWARRHGFKVTKWDETEESYRIRQREPRTFRTGSFRTISLGMVKAVIGCPK